MNKNRYGIVVVLFALLMGGCAVTPPAPVISPAEWNSVKLQRQALTHWGMTGRAAVAALNNEGWSANMDWSQEDRQSQLQLRGTFGIGSVRVLSDGKSLDIETSKGEKFSGEEAMTILERSLGISLPLQSLRFWLLGVPQPDLPALALFGDQGHLNRLDQDGWRITYDRYAPSSQSLQQTRNASMPGRIVLEKNGVRVRVIVDRWHL